MKTLIQFLSFILILISHSGAFAQTDTKFWFAAPEITSGHGDSPIFLRFATFSAPSIITVSIPSNPAFSPIVIALAANSAQSVDLTAFKAMIESNPNVIGITGILVEATTTITAYYEVARSNNTDIFALKGRNALGNKFYMPFEHSWNHQTGLVPKGHTAALVVATEDETDVTFTPTKNIVAGAFFLAAGSTYTVTLDRGQVFSLAQEEPTGLITAVGTLIESNKPIAVTLCQDSKRTGTGGCYDIMGDQIVPVNILGTDHIVMRGFLGAGSGTAQDERVVVTATQNGTTILFNGAAVGGTLNAGQSFIVSLPAASVRNSLVTSKPAYVMHYSGFGCEGGGALIPPMVCTGSRRVAFTRSSNEFFGVTLLVGAGHEGNFTLNGVPIPTTNFAVVPGTGGAYVSAQIDYTAITSVPVGTASVIENSTSLFHLGIINGGAATGCRYGYFSSFNAVSLGPDITVSYGATITLDAGTPFGVTYTWSNGATTQVINVGIWLLGQYSVQVDMGSCILSDTVCIGTSEYVWMGYKDRNWNDPANWSKPCNVNTPPTCYDDVIIVSEAIRMPLLNATVDGEAYCRKLDLRPTTFIDFTPTGILNICGDFIHAGGLNSVPGSTVRFNGGAQGQLYSFRNATASGVFENVVINNTTPNANTLVWNYVAIDSVGATGNMVISPTGSLTLLNGLLQTAANREVIVNNKNTNAVVMHNVNSYVAGRLRRSTNALGSYDLPVGLALPLPPTVVNVAGKSASLNNSPTWVSDNACGSASTVMNLSGTNQYLTVPAAAIVLGNLPRTVAVWAKTSTFNNGALFSFGNLTLANAFILRTRTGVTNGWRMEFGTSGVDVTLAGSNVGWHHYAMTYDGDVVNLYYDGVLASTVNIALNTTNATLFIGRYPAATVAHFNGRVENFKVFNSALTATEIDRMKCIVYGCSFPAPPELVSFYDFVEGAGSNAHYKSYTCFPPNKTYQLANINFNQANTVDNLLAFFNKYPALPGATGQMNICGANWNVCNALNNGFWTINAFMPNMTQFSGSPTANYITTLYNRDYSNACGNGTVMKRANGAAAWSIPAPTTGCLDASLTSTSKGWMTGFSDFATAQSVEIVILPIELLSLEAKAAEKSIFVKWKTASEKLNKGFEIMRSEDGVNFEKIGFVEGKGTTANTQDYVFEDENARVGKLYYYRLRQIDLDGKVFVTKIVSAIIKPNENNNDGLLSIYPNPTEGKVTLDFSALDSQKYPKADVQVITNLGITLETQELDIRSQFKHELDLSKYASGMYIIIVRADDVQMTVKVQKQ